MPIIGQTRIARRAKPGQWGHVNRAHPFAHGLLAAWLTNESAGLTLRDASGNGHHATIASSGGWTMGPWGPTHDYTSIANADAGDISGTLFSADFTVAVRFMTPTVSTDFLWGKETAASNGMAMFLRAGNDRVELRGSSLAMTTADGLINGGQWHTVVASRANTSLILVVDGKVQASQTYTLDNKRAASFKLGATSFTALLPFDGIIDVAMVWENRGLSASEAREWCEDPTAMFWPAPRTYFIPAAAGGGATVSPTAGSLTLTGATPSIALLINRSLTAGALTLTGEQPSVSRQVQKTPASASLTLTGAAPVVAFNITRTPAAAALTITGQQPGVLVETPGVTEVQPNAGVLTLTGESPAIAIKIDRSPTAASLTLTGEQPSVAVESFKDVQPTAASLTLTGASPSIALKVNVSPSVATLSITGAEIGVSVPGLGRTTSAGSSKGRRRAQRGYPRRVVIDGVVYTVRSAEELRRLLAAQHERLQEELQALSPEAPATKARSLKRQITVVQKKIDATERDYMQAILDDDDEVITVWAMLQ